MKSIKIMILGLCAVMPMQASEKSFLMHCVGTVSGYFIAAGIDLMTPDHLKAPAIIACQKAKISALEAQAASQKVEIVALKSKLDDEAVKKASLGFKKLRRASV